MPLRTLPLTALGVVLLTAGPGDPTEAADFVARTRVFQPPSREAVFEARVAFVNGLVIETDPANDRWITVFDVPGGIITLFDREAEKKVEIAVGEVIAASKRIEAAAIGADRDQFGVAAIPTRSDARFEIAFSGVHYETIASRPANVEVAQAYGEFSDLATRLNLARNLNGPLFARRRLDEAVAAAGLVPHITTRTQKNGKAVTTTRGETDIIEIQESDRRIADEIVLLKASFETVPLAEFP